METQHKVLSAIAATLIITSGGFVMIDQAAQNAIDNSFYLASNTQSCGGGVRCAARIPFDSPADINLSSLNFVPTLTYLNGSPSNISIHWIVLNQKVISVCQNISYIDNSTLKNFSVESCYNNTQEIESYSIKKGLNTIYLWTDDKPADVAVDWNFQIKNIDMSIYHVPKTVTFDTHRKGWAQWGVYLTFPAEYQVYQSSYSSSITHPYGAGVRFTALQTVNITGAKYQTQVTPWTRFRIWNNTGTPTVICNASSVTPTTATFNTSCTVYAGQVYIAAGDANGSTANMSYNNPVTHPITTTSFNYTAEMTQNTNIESTSWTANTGYAIGIMGLSILPLQENTSMFTNYQNCTLNSTGSSNLTDFPVYCDMNTSYLIAQGWMNSSCKDIRPTFINTSNTSQTILSDYEIENNTCNTTHTIIWVRLPSFIALTNNTIQVYYGNKTVADRQNVSGVWRNHYKVVYHGGETSGTVVVDSSNNNNGTLTGTINKTTGKFGNGWTSKTSGLGASNYISFSSINPNTNNYTLTGWYYYNSSTPGQYNMMVAATGTDFYTYFLNTSNNLNIDLGASKHLATATNTVSRDQWVFMGYRYQTGAESSIINTSYGNATGSFTPDSFTTYYMFRNKYTDASSGFAGIFDEIRISDVNRSDDWMRAEASMISTMGPQQNTSAGPSGIVWAQIVANQTINHNGTPYIISIQFNATNNSPDCTVQNYTSNNSNIPINLTNGWVNISGPNITKTGVYYTQINASDNCANTISQNLWFNITNTIPNNTTVLLSYMTGYEGDTVRAYCYASDPDGDNLTINWNIQNDTMGMNTNSTTVASETNLSLYNFTTGAGANYTLNCESSDALSSSPAQITTLHTKNINVSVSLCTGINLIVFEPNSSLINVSNYLTTQSKLATNTTNCTLQFNASNETITLSIWLMNNISNNSYKVSANGINLTTNYTNIVNVTAGNITKINLTGFWINASALQRFPFRLSWRVTI